MNTDGFPPLTPPADAPAGPAPETKLSPDLGSLRAARSQPARYNGRIAAVAATSAAVFVVGAIFIPPMFAKTGHHKTASQAQSANSQPQVPPVQAISYDAPPADPASGAGGLDCSQYPGMPGCAAMNAAAATPAGPLAGQVPGQPAGTAAPAVSVSLSLPGSDTAASARSSGLFFGGSLGAAGQALASATGAPALTAQPPTPLPSPPGGFQGPDRPQAADVLAQNGQGEKTAFGKLTASQDYVAARLQKPQSPYEVKAGTVIPAALLTAINSDLPGEVIAQVTQPVYDHVLGRYVLIPQGSRLLGRYDSQVAYGQTRAMVIWHRVIFPNGNSINFGNMGATDEAGAAGVSDRVNSHFGALAQGVILSSILSMGVASAQDANARSSGTLVLNSGATGIANSAESVGSRLTDRELNRQPTIEIRQGAQVRVLVDKDMIIEPYT